MVQPTLNNITRRALPPSKRPTTSQNQYSLLEDNLDMSCDESVSSLTINNNKKLIEAENSGMITLEQMNMLLNRMRTDIVSEITISIKREVNAAVNSALETIRQEFTATTDFLAAEQKDLKTEIESSKKDIKELEAKNFKLQSLVTSFERRVESAEKMSRSLNLEIQAVPERKGENVVTHVKNLCKKVNVPMTDSEIHACRRVAKMDQSSSRPRNILVTLSSMRHRDNIISAVKRYNKANSTNKLNSSDLEITGEACPIFVTEHLSPAVKEIHAAARKIAKEKSYKFVWVKFNRVFMRKDDKSPYLRIKSLECLNNLS
ncbi:unnamed protein product [Plutella xylostella]|uniref:(diamondback moth) hypothetical protein n=1 Tax=Plutella xylostella TaxID=51655 RepID=A0A8S4GE12_PLUXY|nr:unnamed protein product [Plutella xylostella]